MIEDRQPNVMIMSSMTIEALPRELIAHIASFVEALSVVALSETNKTIRAACWDSLLFKAILQKSQRVNWGDERLDVEAIAKRAGNDVSIWARYAVANDKAWVLSRMQGSVRERKYTISFLPELALVKHPSLKQHDWLTATHGPFDYLTGHVFCLTMAVLSAHESNLSRYHDPGQCEYCYPKPRENDPAFLSAEGSLWTLCSVAITLCKLLINRKSVWPYNNAANVPFIDFPRAPNIPLRPISDGYGLPVPFSNTTKELLNKWSPCTGGWDDWYRAHSHALFSSPDFLTTGIWCGYYTQSHGILDPPMTGIRFKHSYRVSSLTTQTTVLSARHCIDGIHSFQLSGSMSWDDKAVVVTLRKTYTSGLAWDWDCRLTPFGIVGHWGQKREEGFITHGYVWLWKEEWSKEAGRGKGD